MSVPAARHADVAELKSVQERSFERPRHRRRQLFASGARNRGWFSPSRSPRRRDRSDQHEDDHGEPTHPARVLLSVKAVEPDHLTSIVSTIPLCPSPSELLWLNGLHTPRKRRGQTDRIHMRQATRSLTEPDDDRTPIAIRPGGAASRKTPRCARSSRAAVVVLFWRLGTRPSGILTRRTTRRRTSGRDGRLRAPHCNEQPFSISTLFHRRRARPCCCSRTEFASRIVPALAARVIAVTWWLARPSSRWRWARRRADAGGEPRSVAPALRDSRHGVPLFTFGGAACLASAAARSPAPAMAGVLLAFG